MFVVVPTMFVSENHRYVTACHGEDFVSRGSAAALDEVDRVLTTHFDTKILPRIGPTACGEEVIEGKHLGRTIRRSPQGYEWESNSKHVEDMVARCGLKQESKGAPTLITKATGKGRRETSMTTWSHMMCRLSDRRQARDSTCRSIVHHCSLQRLW